jgi:SAM-dependent methyltransferase
MKPALVANKPKYPVSWSDIPMGAQLLSELQVSLQTISRQMFGYYLLKAGSLSSQLALPDCQIKRIVQLDNLSQNQGTLIAQRNALPLKENSVDAVILANELDFARDPHHILREVDRVIRADGYLVISGFNPLSLTGLIRTLPVKQQHVLRQARFFPLLRVKDWLQLLGFEIVACQHLLYGELFCKHLFATQGRSHKLLNRFCPWSSVMYVIVARKRETPLSLIKHKWSLQSKPKFSAVGATARSPIG